MGFMSSSTPSVAEAEPAVVTVGANDSYNTEKIYDAKASKRKGLLSTILSKSTKTASTTVGAQSQQLG